MTNWGITILSWKCDICDSYNEDRLRKCYVCGHVKITIPEQKNKEIEDPLMDEILDKPFFNTRKNFGFRFCGLFAGLLWIAWVILSVFVLLIDPPDSVFGIIITLISLLFFIAIPYHFSVIAYRKRFKTGTWIWFFLSVIYLLIIVMLLLI